MVALRLLMDSLISFCCELRMVVPLLQLVVFLERVHVDGAHLVDLLAQIVDLCFRFLHIDLELSEFLDHGLELGVIGVPDGVLQVFDLHAEFGAFDLIGRKPFLRSFDIVPHLPGLFLGCLERLCLDRMRFLLRNEDPALRFEDLDMSLDLGLGLR